MSDTRAIELGRMYVMRELLDGLIDTRERELAIEPSAVPSCPHPVDKRKYAPGTMGGLQRYTCADCGEDITEPIAPTGG